MGYYKLTDTDSLSISKFTSRIGEIITLSNSLDHDLQIFIESIIDLENGKPTNADVINLVRSFSFSRRLDFLKTLVRTKHNDQYQAYIDNIHIKIKNWLTTRNRFAHSQVYFWDNDQGSHMMISNLKKIDTGPAEEMFDQISVEELNDYIQEIKELIQNFKSFTYDLGYFQGHKV